MPGSAHSSKWQDVFHAVDDKTGDEGMAAAIATDDYGKGASCDKSADDPASDGMDDAEGDNEGDVEKGDIFKDDYGDVAMRKTLRRAANELYVAKSYSASLRKESMANEPTPSSPMGRGIMKARDCRPGDVIHTLRGPMKVTKVETSGNRTSIHGRVGMTPHAVHTFADHEHELAR